MLISLDWINDFVKLPTGLKPQEVGERLTMATAEVEATNVTGAFWQEIRVAEITGIEKHPEADKLNLVTFKLSDKESFRVVCGAANVRIGLKTPFAPIGTTLPVGFTLEPKKIRGVLSEGMLCSEEELGLAETSQGIMELPADTTIGVTLKELWDKKQDVIFDIDNKSLTHRPDLWGHYGFAREFATIYSTELKDSFSPAWLKKHKESMKGGESPIKVKVHQNSACRAYFALSMDNVSVKPSPAWMQTRLLAAGLRPINNIVDISNYVMLELGHPLHIFDRDLIAGDQVIIEALENDASFMTLDDQERALKPGDTIIKDGDKNLVLAGIMGGASSSVRDETKSILIEVANWDAARIRQTSTRLGLRTDSSTRYEKTLDSLACETTLIRTYELIRELCPEAQAIGHIEYDGDDLEKLKGETLSIQMSADRIRATLGKNVPTTDIQSLLESLAFKVRVTGEDLDIIVPSFRATKDIQGPADIIEEVGRVIGYDSIDSEGPLLDVTPVRLTTEQKLKRQIQDFFSIHARAFEVNTYPLVGEKLHTKLGWPTLSEKPLKLLNALSKDQSIMRDSMIPSLLEAAILNSKNYNTCRFFEIGRSYISGDKEFAQERYQFALVYYNKEESCFLPLLNDVDRALDFLNIPGDITDRHPKFSNNLVDESWSGLHPFEYKNIRVMGKMDGVLFSVHPLTLKKLKVKGHVSIAVVDYTNVVQRPLKDKVKYTPLSLYPGSRFDFTLTMKWDSSVKEVFDIIAKCKIKELQSYGVVDIYCENNDATSDKHITFTTYFADPNKTLEGDYIKSLETKIISKLEQSGMLLKSS